MNIRYIIERKHRLKGKGFGQLINTSINILENRFRGERLVSLPMTLQIEPTNRCNLFCKQCFRYDPASRRELGDMSFSKFKKIIAQFPNVFEVSLIGLGESFLNKDLYKMIDFLGTKKIDVSLTTNGTKIDNKIIDSINRVKKVAIQFSLDAATRKTYKKIRGVDCFDKVISNIQRFMKLKDDKVAASLGLVVMQENLNELDDFIGLAGQLNINRIHFGDLSGSWLSDNRDELIIDKKEKLNDKIQTAQNFAEKLGIILKYNRYEYIWGDDATLTRCWFLWQYPYITWDGFVTTCCNLPNPSINNLGNVYETPFNKIWNNKDYCNLRKLIKEARPHKICKSCHLAN